MPNPRKNEKESEFISRCIPDLRHEGKPQDQAIAICYSLWRGRKKTFKEAAEEIEKRLVESKE